MAYESGFPMHAAGTAMTFAAIPGVPSALPIALAFTISCTNPGEIEKASREWHEAAKKFDAFRNDLLQLARDLPASDWTGDDREAFTQAINLYGDELDKARSIIHNVGNILEIAALVCFILAILCVAIGTFLLALSLIVLGVIAVPFVGQAVYAAAQSIATGLIGVVDPAIVGTQSAMLLGKTVLALCVAALVGAYGGDQIGFGVGQPAFRDVEINMPNAPGV